MRIRYQMAREAGVAICDLSEKKARQIYSELERDGLCEWAELVGEDDDNYMEVLESFDHIESARRVAWHMKKLKG